jgi:hypothetical protein
VGEGGAAVAFCFFPGTCEQALRSRRLQILLLARAKAVQQSEREREAQQRVSSCIRAHGWLARTQTDTKGRWSARDKVARRARGEPWAPNNGAVAVLAQPEQGGMGWNAPGDLRERAFFLFLQAGASRRSSGNGRHRAED